MQCLHGQDYDRNWVMGFTNLVLKFNEDSFEVDSSSIIYRSNYFLNSSCSMSDTNGLRFFSDGAKAYDKYGGVMQNGDKFFLSQSDLQNTFSDTSVGHIILNNPICLPYCEVGDSFIVIHKSLNDTVPSHDVFYSVVDMKENNGLGKVVTTSQSMARRMSGSNITACKHANGKDWWIVGRMTNSNKYVKWLFNSNGNLSVVDTQSVGSIYSNPDFLVQNIFSERGDVFVTGGQYQTAIMQFDRCSGVLQFKDSISAPYDSLYNGITGMQLSKSGRYLYITRYNTLSQYNLNASDVNASYVELVDLRIHNIYRKLQHMQTTPNGKIFIAGYGSPIPFSIINYPDSAGFSCGLDTFVLPFNNSLSTSGMPTYPHYRTPPVEVWQAGAGNSREVCDSIITANGVTLGKPHVNGVSYQWSSPTNINFSSTAPQPTVQPTGTTTYIVHLQDTVSTYYSCTERWDTVTITVVQSCVSSVGHSPATGGGFKVYPNPASDQVSITAEVKGKWQLTDALGRVVVEQQIEQGTTTIATEQLAAGVYYYLFTTSQKVQQYGKLVKQ